MRENVDHIFRRKLADGTLPVSQVLWERLEPHLPKADKRRPKGLIWIFGAGLLLLTGTLAWWYQASKSVQNDSGTETELSLTQTNTASDNIPAIEDESRQGLSNSSQQVASSNATTSTSINNSSASVKDGITQFTSTRSQKTSDPSFYEIAEDNQGIISNVVSHTQNELSVSVENAGAVEKPTSGSNRFPVFIALLEERTTPLPLFGRRLPDPAKDCYRFGKKNNAGGGILFAEAYAGPLGSMRKLTSRNEDVSSYIESRDSTEQSRLSWNAGLRLGYWHHSGITARVGAHYTLVNELFDYFDGSTSTTVFTYDTIRDGQGNIVSIETDTVTITGQRIKKTHNRYHTIDVPLLLGYQVSHGHWAFGIHGGPVFNIAFIRKGDILAPDGKPVSITDSDPNPYPAFKDKLGMSAYLGAHVSKRFGYRFWVYAEPFVHHRLKTLTIDSYPIDQRQTNIGLSVGLRAILH